MRKKIVITQIISYFFILKFKKKEFPDVLKELNLYELDISGNPIKKFPKKLKSISLKGDGKFI
ncbi:MAG: hypothetical protein ACFFDH_10195 [Promethearchaeota archaeon]